MGDLAGPSLGFTVVGLRAERLRYLGQNDSFPVDLSQRLERVVRWI
jgi:hypothetical protein